MGTIRLLLAFAVLLSHYHVTQHKWTQFVGPFLAVQTFFMISGFYMGLVLDTRYSSKFAFWASRLVRIYPVYLITALAALVLLMYTGSLRWPGTYWAIVNVTIVGQEFAFFPNVEGMLLNAPSWSLSLELMFYALAPYIWRLKTAWLVGGALVSVCIYVALYFTLTGLAQEAWTLRFFPAEVGFFLGGMIAYRRYRAGAFIVPNWPPSIILGAVSTILLYGYVPHSYPWRDLAFLGGFFLVLPAIFQVCKHSKLDRLVGDISYPVYLVHVPVYQLLWTFFQAETNVFRLFGVLLTLTISIALANFIDAPLDQFRHRIAVTLARRRTGKPLGGAPGFQPCPSRVPHQS